MCGIAGVIYFGDKQPEKTVKAAEQMSRRLHHRGPDDWGLVELKGGAILDLRMNGEPAGTQRNRTEHAHGDVPHVVLAHNRLSIIDLTEGGHQPMSTKDGRYWIVYNGEIYNYKEIRAQLENQGITFHTSSDTEVLLELMALEGARGLARLRGMFAFALWDEVEKKMMLVRDRFGMKPLYYAVTAEGALLFASEMKALLSSDWISPNLNDEAMSEFLQFGSIEAPRTCYREIAALLPGTVMSWSPEQSSQVSYWSLLDCFARANNDYADEKTLGRKTSELILNSVKAHSVSDVPIGVFLSGGLDSALIVASTRHSLGGGLKSFTLTFPGWKEDEGRLARMTAKHFKTEHHELALSEQDFHSGIEAFVETIDQPSVDGMNTYFVSKLAREHGIKVVLSGTGGDEIFGGYASFTAVPGLHAGLQSLKQIPGASRLLASLVRRLPFRQVSKFEQMLSRKDASLEQVWSDYRSLLTKNEMQMLKIETVHSLRNQSIPFAATKPSFWTIAALETSHFLIPQLLRDADVVTMAHGLELRTPFVDHVLFEQVMAGGRWPIGRASSHKMALFSMMKDLVAIPELYRAKRGFTLPFDAWLSRELFDEKGGSGRGGSEIKGILRQKKYERFVEAFRKRKLHWSRIWAIYIYERFKQNGK